MEAAGGRGLRQRTAQLVVDRISESPGRYHPRWCPPVARSEAVARVLQLHPSRPLVNERGLILDKHNHLTPVGYWLSSRASSGGPGTSRRSGGRRPGWDLAVRHCNRLHSAPITTPRRADSTPCRWRPPTLARWCRRADVSCYHRRHRLVRSREVGSQSADGAAGTAVGAGVERLAPPAAPPVSST